MKGNFGKTYDSIDQYHPIYQIFSIVDCRPVWLIQLLKLSHAVVVAPLTAALSRNALPSLYRLPSQSRPFTDSFQAATADADVVTPAGVSTAAVSLAGASTTVDVAALVGATPDGATPVGATPVGAQLAAAAMTAALSKDAKPSPTLLASQSRPPTESSQAATADAPLVGVTMDPAAQTGATADVAAAKRAHF